MIVLDTNVVSEPLKPGPDAAVLDWLDRQRPGTLFLTATSFGELLLGIERLPRGRRRDALATTLDGFLNAFFGDRILPYDDLAAKRYAPMVANARTAGRAISVSDGQIAAVAASHEFAVATRDTAPFIAAGVPVINPWNEG